MEVDMMMMFGFGMFVPFLVLLVAVPPLVRLIRRYMSDSLDSSPRDSELAGFRPGKPDAAIITEAKRRRGTLSLSDVVLVTGYEYRRAEEYMDGLAREGRVRMDVDDEGTIRYVFPDLIQ